MQFGPAGALVRSALHAALRRVHPILHTLTAVMTDWALADPGLGVGRPQVASPGPRAVPWLQPSRATACLWLAVAVGAAAWPGPARGAFPQGPEVMAAQADRLVQPSPKRALASVKRPPDATRLMDWAEVAYPDIFPSRRPNQSAPPFTYRSYPETGHFLGTDGVTVFVLGPVTGGQLTPVGQLADFTCAIQPLDCAGPMPVGVPVRFGLYGDVVNGLSGNQTDPFRDTVYDTQSNTPVASLAPQPAVNSEGWYPVLAGRPHAAESTVLNTGLRHATFQRSAVLGTYDLHRVDLAAATLQAAAQAARVATVTVECPGSLPRFLGSSRDGTSILWAYTTPTVSCTLAPIKTTVIDVGTGGQGRKFDLPGSVVAVVNGAAGGVDGFLLAQGTGESFAFAAFSNGQVSPTENRSALVTAELARVETGRFGTIETSRAVFFMGGTTRGTTGSLFRYDKAARVITGPLLTRLSTAASIRSLGYDDGALLLVAQSNLLPNASAPVSTDGAVYRIDDQVAGVATVIADDLGNSVPVFARDYFAYRSPASASIVARSKRDGALRVSAPDTGLSTLVASGLSNRVFVTSLGFGDVVSVDLDTLALTSHGSLQRFGVALSDVMPMFRWPHVRAHVAAERASSHFVAWARQGRESQPGAGSQLVWIDFITGNVVASSRFSPPAVASVTSPANTLLAGHQGFFNFQPSASAPPGLAVFRIDQPAMTFPPR